MFLSGTQILLNGCVMGRAPHINGAGVDLRVGSVGRLNSGIVRLQHISNEDVVWLKTNKNDEYNLQVGKAYLVVTEEIISAQTIDHPPKPLMGIVKPRSSLASCGQSLTAGFVDPGYQGPLRMLLVSHNNGFYLKKGDRFCQIAFATVGDGAEMYQGHYQNRVFG